MADRPKNSEKKLCSKTRIPKGYTCDKSYGEFTGELGSLALNTKWLGIRVIRWVYCICQILRQSTNGKGWIALLRSALFKAWQGQIRHFRKHAWITEREGLNRICPDTSESRDFRPQTVSSDFQDGIELGSSERSTPGREFVDEVLPFVAFTHLREFGIELGSPGLSTAPRILGRIDGLVRGFTALTNSLSK